MWLEGTAVHSGRAAAADGADRGASCPATVKQTLAGHWAGLMVFWQLPGIGEPGCCSAIATGRGAAPHGVCPPPGIGLNPVASTSNSNMAVRRRIMGKD